MKELYPEFAHKVRDLLFVRPEYSIIGEACALKKHSDAKVIEVLFVGRDAKRKGLEPVISACKVLNAKMPGAFRLTVVSNMHDGLIDLMNEEFITYHASLPHEDVMSLMRNAHIYIMPSLFESYGLVYHEAMANGCVIFVRNGYPQKEFIDYGKCGYSVDARDVEDIVDKLEECIRDRKKRCNMAMLARSRYIERYSQNVIKNQWIRVFEEATECQTEPS